MNNELYPTSFKVNQNFNRNSMPASADACSTFKPLPIAQSNKTQISPASKDLLKQKQQLIQRQLVPNVTNKSFLNNNNGRLKPTFTSAQQTNSNNTAINSASNQIILNNKVNLRSKSPPPVPPQRYVSQLSSNQYIPDDQPDASHQSSVLWRSKSFAGGLQQNTQIQDDSNYAQQQKAKISLRQPPITYANPNIAAAQANRNTIHLGKQLDDKLYGFNNNNSNLSCNQNCCKPNQLDDQMFLKSKGNLNKVNNEISKRYLAAAENNFNAANGLNKMKHSTSHHSYLSSKAPVQQQQANQFQTGTLPNSITYHGQLNGQLTNQLTNQLNGQLNPKQHPGSLDASSLSSIGSSGSGSLTRSSTFLSQKYASVGNLSQTRKFFDNLSLGSKNSRNPQPQRSLPIFVSIEKGLRECICLTQEDISQLKSAIGNGEQLSSAQQYKNAERYLKRLEFQLAKIEELRDQYEMHLKMSDGVRSMATAYAFSPGKEREVALSSVRNELKDYIQTMSIVETELEQSMGTLLLQMQGIQGFARLCTGDVFEITIKCGEKQKWKCKGKILKDNVQSWNSTEQIFRPNLTEQLSIKAVELRGLGKKLCLGSKNCEIKDLFSARPQLMSICLNTTGTLKLHLIVTWNPLHEPKTSLNGALSSSLGNALTGSSLTKSKSFTASSTSLFSRFRNGGSNSTNNSSAYSTLNLSNPHSFGQSFMNNTLLNKSLNKRCTLPSGFEIIDADYYHHPHLIAENNRQIDMNNKRLTMHGGLPVTVSSSINNKPVSRVNSMLIPSSNALKHNNRHSYAGFNHTSLSPIHSPNLRNDDKDDEEDEDKLNNDNKAEKCQQQQQQQQQNKIANNLISTTNTANIDGITPTSTGSRGSSSLHLTGTTSSGFGSSGSSSSYCSSVPNSALTSPDSELAPLESTNNNNKKQQTRLNSKSVSEKSISNNSSPIQCDISECGHCGSHSNNVVTNLNNNNNTNANVNKNRNSIIVEATIHQSPETVSQNETIQQQQIPRSISMPVQLSNNSSEQNSNNNIKQSTTNNRTESMDTLTTSDVAYSQPTYFNVGDTLINLISSLEDIQGQFSELHSLQKNVLNLYKVLTQISKLRTLNLNLQNNNNKVSSTAANIIRNINNVNNVKANASAASSNQQPHERVRRSSDASNISVSVESALECFDFLNQAGTDSEVDSVVCTPEHKPNKNKLILQTDDNKQGDNDSALSTPCPTPSPSLQPIQQLSTDCSQIDIALMSHLVYSQRLIENLGAFGPLRSREQSSLAKLQLQAQAIERLVRVCVNLKDYLQFSIELRKDNRLKQNPMSLAMELEDLNNKFKQQQDLELASCFGNDSRTSKLWNFISYLHQMENEDEQLANQFSQIDSGDSSKQNISLGNTLLCVTSAGFALCLEKFMQINNLVPGHSANNTTTASSLVNSLSISMSNLTGLGLSTATTANTNYKLKGTELTTRISELITKRLIDAPKFESDFVVSLFQLHIFFQTENASLEHLFKSYAQEVQLLHSICSNDAIEIEQSLKQFKRTLPPKEPLNCIALLLLDSDPLIVRIAEAYFLNAAKNSSMRKAILNQLLDALQSDSPNLRQAACMTIPLLNGSEYLNQLVYVCTVDPNADVRNQAKQTLLAFGQEGKQLVLESQRYNNGILYQDQGLIVK